MKTKEPLKMREENWKGLWTQPCRAKRKAHTSTTKVAAKQEFASQKVSRTIYGCIVESHESTRQRVESSLLSKNMKIALRANASLR